MPRRIVLSIVVSLVALCGSAFARQADHLDLWCDAQLSLDASGKVTALDFIGKNGNADPIAQKLAPVIRAWSFVPGSIDGVPMPTETTLSLHLQTQKTGDGTYGLRILDAQTGAAMINMRPPEYPDYAMRNDIEARVIAVISVNSDGVPTRIDITGIGTTNDGDRTSQKIFATAVTVQAKTWRFRPEIVGGHAVTSQMRIPVDFCMNAIPCIRVKDERVAEDAPMPLARPLALDSQVKLVTQVAGTTL